MIYMPAVLTVGFYFERWRALATGLALCGSGVGTFVFSPVTGKLIENLGWRMANMANGGKDFDIISVSIHTYILMK